MRTFFILGILLVAISCLDPMSLPSLDESERRDFNPDTTYLPLTPSWGGEDGLVNPVEVVFAHTRHIFVADIGARDILVFNQAGTRVDLNGQMFATLDFEHLGAEFTPRDMDLDGRLNLLIIDSSNKIYRWNMFWNMHGIDSVANEMLIRNTKTRERLWLSPFNPEIADSLRSSDWVADLDSIRYEQNSAVADSLLRPHEFFNMALKANQEKDIYYYPERTSFSAISGARPDDEFFYATDSMQNRILRATLVRNGAVKLGNGETYFTHTALFTDNVKESGTGAGTVNLPTGLDVDNFGNLYYSQHGKQMYVHSVQPSKASNFPSRFELFVDDIMSPGQYLQPTDVAVSTRQMIYVANTGLQEILVFNGDGSYFNKAGVEKVTIDTTIWVSEGTYLDTSLWVHTDNDSVLVDTTIFISTDSTLVDTFYREERKGQLKKPISVTADERGVVYVCDSEQGGIFRFVLSTSIDEELIDDMNQ